MVSGFAEAVRVRLAGSARRTGALDAVLSLAGAALPDLSLSVVMPQVYHIDHCAIEAISA